MHPIHPMLVHFPIALLSVSVLFDAVAAKWPEQEFRSAGWYTLVLGLGGALLSLVTGGAAEEAVERSGIPPLAIETHETWAFLASGMFAALLMLKIAEWLGWIRWPRAITVAFGVMAVAVLLVASYYGGDLVYRHGAGVERPTSP